MIKGIAHPPDGPCIFLGLSEVNIETLKKRKPILIDLAELGMKGKILIAYGETEDILAEEIKRAGISMLDIIDKRNPQ